MENKKIEITEEIKKEAQRQFDILSRGCDEIINEKEFLRKLEKSIATKKTVKSKTRN